MARSILIPLASLIAALAISGIFLALRDNAPSGISGAQHAHLDGEIKEAEQAFVELRLHKYYWHLLVNGFIPGLFEVPDLELRSPELVLEEEDLYDALSQADSRALYQEKLEYLRSVEEVLARE